MQGLRFLLTVMLLGGCGATDESRTDSCEQPACYTALLFDIDAPGVSVPDCGPHASLTRPGLVDMAVFHGPNQPVGDVLEATQAAARYYFDYEISFRASAPVRELAEHYLITGSEQELEAALDAAGIPHAVELSREEQQRADQIIADIMFRPLTTFLWEHAVPTLSAINVVLIERIVDPKFADEVGISSDLTGLGLSPLLLQRLREEGRSDELSELLALPEQFTPSAFLAQAVLEDLYYMGNAVAHEIGHALGLPHDEAARNLMYPSVGDQCRAELTREQLAAQAGLEPHLVTADSAPLSLAEARNPLIELHRVTTTRVLQARNQRTPRATAPAPFP